MKVKRQRIVYVLIENSKKSLNQNIIPSNNHIKKDKKEKNN